MMWTPDRIERLRELVAQGVSFSDIGTAMGITKNAALSKATRMRFMPDADAPLSEAQVLSRSLRGAPVSAATPQWDFPPHGQCVWPIGDPKDDDFRFCRDGVHAFGQPYCAEHHGQAWRR